jgi:LuxR family maltose regulon positive regulatory protein
MEHHHLTFYLVEGMTLHALALAGLGAMDEALARLQQAVHLGVPNGFVGRFLERGQPMQRLLLALCNHPSYAAQASQARLLLAAFPSPSDNLLHRAVGEPLSERECEVLRLLAEGLSNKAIAQRLMISAHTVRNHTANIFAKLRVENRLQAVARARDLGLLARVVHQ